MNDAWPMEPTALPADDPFAVGPPSRAFSVGAAFSLGGAAFGACYGPLLAVAAISIGIGVATSVVGLVIPLSDLVLSVLIEWPLYPGMAYVGITAARHRRVRVEDMFLGFQCYGRSLLLVLVLSLIALACMAPGMIVIGLFIFSAASLAAPPVLVVTVSILLAVAAIAPVAYVSARLGLAYGMVVDPAVHRLPAMEALSRSWAMTRDVGWSLAWLLVLLLFIASASVLLLCVGYLLLGLPLLIAISGAAYWLIVGNQGHLCLACGYDLTGSHGAVCPECGQPVRRVPRGSGTQA